MQISPSEYKTLSAFYGKGVIDAILTSKDTTLLQLAKEYRLTEYQGKKFISLGRKINIDSRTSR